jgi:hypothetical protein
MVLSMAGSRLKKFARRVPGVAPLYRRLLAAIPRRLIFSRIYSSNTWDGEDSISGPGSNLEQTRVLVAELPGLLDRFDVHSVLDIPCGDFHWMRHVCLDGIAYTGADIVSPLIEKNKRAYESETIHFRTLDLIKGPLPRADLILCRDCLVHLSFKDIWSALQAICDSGATHLLTTTFTRRDNNQDIVTGHWRRLNLQAVPFMFPAPLEVLNEGCTEGGGENDDKSLGLWKIEDIAASLRARSLPAGR